MSSVTYEAVDNALQRLDIAADAAECHGICTALICTLGEDGRARFFDKGLPELAQALQSGDALAAESRGVLDSLFDDTLRQLGSGQFHFQLFLPADELPLADRARALGAWCQGFMIGLQLGGITGSKKLPGDLPEVLRDIAEISKASTDDMENGEEEEASYAELVEYIRVGVMLFREEFQPYLEADRGGTLH
jgi:uncharacterized protein YgfB (UPF0149 family)